MRGIRGAFWTVLMAGALAAPAGALPAGERPSADIVVNGHRPRAIHPDALGTRTIDGGVTLYDARFRRVSRTDADHPLVRRIAARLAGLSPQAQLALAKQEVERRVAFTSDSDHLGVADLWLNAGETLDKGKGDDEDIAIAQMQILKAAGFAAQDLYLTLGRDRQREPHFVLLARTPGGYYIIDRDMRGVQRADRTNGFVPMVSVGVGKSWVHGYATAGAPRGRVQTAAR